MPPEPQHEPPAEKDRQERILDATLSLLARHGIAGVSIRSVAREAGVALGLVNYYFDDKTGLVRAALLRIEEQDIQLVRGARLDCDGDAILLEVEQVGPACHTGTRTCFDADDLEPAAAPERTP